MAQDAPQTALDRLKELWPRLDAATQNELVAIAEQAADDEVDFPLTPEEEASLDQARRDFAEGRTLTHEEMVASFERMVTRLK
jgi:predicted transcriptional regulator